MAWSTTQHYAPTYTCDHYSALRPCQVPSGATRVNVDSGPEFQVHFTSRVHCSCCGHPLPYRACAMHIVHNTEAHAVCRLSNPTHWLSCSPAGVTLSVSGLGASAQKEQGSRVWVVPLGAVSWQGGNAEWGIPLCSVAKLQQAML